MEQKHAVTTEAAENLLQERSLLGVTLREREIRLRSKLLDVVRNEVEMDRTSNQ